MNWLEKLAPLSQPMRNKTKANRDLVVRVFLRFASVTIVSNSDWFITVYACCDWPV